jgi:hypothetical protein
MQQRAARRAASSSRVARRGALCLLLLSLLATTATAVTAAAAAGSDATATPGRRSGPRRALLFETSAVRILVFELFDAAYKFLDAELYAGLSLLLNFLLSPLDSL